MPLSPTPSAAPFVLQHRAAIGEPKTKKSRASVPVIAPLARMLETHRFRCGNPTSGPIFANTLGRPLDLDGLFQREMKEPLREAGIPWQGWHGFRRGLATNLNRLGISDKVNQQLMRHSNISTTQNIYIKPTSSDAVAAMKQWQQSEQLRELESVMFPELFPNGDFVPRRVVN